MGYVIYNADTTKLVITKQYKTAAAAKAALTRYLNKEHKKSGWIDVDGDYKVAHAETYYEFIERKVERVNMMSGKTYWESINTPSYCSPASEAYWSA